MHENSALQIHLGGLAEVIGSVQKLPDGYVHGSPCLELLLYFQPLLPGIHASTLTAQARNVKLGAVVLAYIMTVSGWNLDPALVIHPGCVVTPQHTVPDASSFLNRES